MNRILARYLRFCFLLAGMVFSLPLAAQQFQILGSLYPEDDDQSNSMFPSVSGDGSVVVGQATSFIEGRGTVWQAFRWSEHSGMEGLGFISTDGGFMGSIANGVSYDGSIIAGNSTSGSGSWQSFRWTSETGMNSFTDSAFGVNGLSGNGSAIVGSIGEGQASYWTSSEGVVGLGFLPGASHNWSVALAASQDASVIVGESANSTSTPGNNYEAFRWTSTEGMTGLGWLSGGLNMSYASAVSSDGTVVVGTSNSSNGFEAFLWTEAEGMMGLGGLSLANFYSEATGISADGSIVVGNSRSFQSGNSLEPFLWTRDGGMQSLSAMLLNRGVDLQGWQLNTASAISADGNVIVGEARRMLGNDLITQVYRVSLVAVPEPSSGVLFWMSLAFLYFRRRIDI